MSGWTGSSGVEPRDATLASDADRDRAVQQLSEAFAQGRLATAELDERTSRALAARTYGDLDQVLAGLGGLELATRRHPARTVVLWLATVLFSPFVLLSGLFVLFGGDMTTRVMGMIFLALTGTPLYCVWRWSRATP
ncbi:protein of unknown function [Nocardioides terrae]|uniref:DUF1707 domain-containing protein n=1 Tax=Nocardioides terrae TaxID=574651 RepID=A0A1I1FQE1_9ACTN|nr:DUF1707 domain-containing protein [Nocardioides terrae]SFB99200.1 protein of unknown function [Nocardioides terrae]